MPEIAEVRTVAKTLNRQLVGRRIVDVTIYYSKMIEGDLKTFQESILDTEIKSVTNYGKWLFFELEEKILLSHLRMEGKYFIKSRSDALEKHEHVVFALDNGSDLRYHDTRKFGRMKIVSKEEVYKLPEISKLGLEPDDKKLTGSILYEKIKDKKKPIKSLLLDQTIVNGLGNIYVDEVLFASCIHPEVLGVNITKRQADILVESAGHIIKRATELGGSTIRSYTSSLGVIGSYQNELKVHTKENSPCPNCRTNIRKITVGGRGTYFCPKCQKRK